MASTDWETYDGKTISDYMLVEGRGGSKYCLQPVSGRTPTFKPVGSEYINRHEITVQFAYKANYDLSFSWEYKDDDNRCLFVEDSGEKRFEIHVAGVTVFSQTLTLGLADSSWYVVKIDYKYNDTYGTHWVRFSYLNTSLDWVEIKLIVLTEDLVYSSSDNRKMFFLLEEDGTQLDDISIGA